MSTRHDANPFKNFSDNELILAIEQGNLAAQEYALKKYEQELLEILQDSVPAAARLSTSDVRRTAVAEEAKYPYKSKLLIILAQILSSMTYTTEHNSFTAPLRAYFDTSQFTANEIADIVHLLSDAYRSIGGDGLVIKRIDLSDTSSITLPCHE
jgi:hypothetical protein